MPGEQLVWIIVMARSFVARWHRRMTVIATVETQRAASPRVRL